MPKKTRNRFTAQEKVDILRLHLLEHPPISDLCDRHGIHPTMFYRSPNRHNGRIPRDLWLEAGEKAKIVAFHDLDPSEGYHRLAYMMLDADVVAVCPSSVYRVPKEKKFAQSRSAELQ